MPRTELGNEELQFEPTQGPTPFSRSPENTLHDFSRLGEGRATAFKWMGRRSKDGSAAAKMALIKKHHYLPMS
jgi:hypothetical protein